MSCAPFAIASRANSGSLMRNFWTCADEARENPLAAEAELSWSAAQVAVHRKRVHSDTQTRQNWVRLNEIDLNGLNEFRRKREIVEFFERQAHEALPSPCAGN